MGGPGNEHFMEVAYASVMCLWLSSMSMRYDRMWQDQAAVWGADKTQTKESARQDFRPELLDTWRVLIIRWFHWGLACITLVEMVYCCYKINAWRGGVMQSEGDVDVALFGTVSKATAMSMGKYLITINIKILDYGWDYVST